MSDNPKSRGLKHRHNKNRFKDKSKVVSADNVAVKKENEDKSKTRLTSNWDRYNESLEDGEDNTGASNFALLSQAPLSQGGHFQFKKDKVINQELDSFERNKAFALDVVMLESSLSTILFHERCGLDASYLTEEELQEITVRSNENRVAYESYLKLIGKDSSNLNQHKETLDDSVNFILKDVDRCCIKQKDGSSLMESKCDELLVQPDKAELEDWLDDILND